MESKPDFKDCLEVSGWGLVFQGLFLANKNGYSFQLVPEVELNVQWIVSNMCLYGCFQN